MKFQAVYKVTVYNQNDTVIVGANDGQKNPDLTCHFTVTRGILSDSNKCTIQLYNLAPKTRSQIFQDAFQGFNQENWKFVKLEAGYDGSLTPIFMGRILQAYSFRKGGQTDVITEIQAQALDMFDCQTSHTFEAGTTYQEAIQTVVTTDMPNVSIGNVGNLNGVFQTPTTIDGNAMSAVNQIAGGNAFIDNNQLNILLSNEVIDVPVPVITQDNGLLDTPNRRDANLEVKMLFEPSLIVGQLLEIRSGVQSEFNGQYKVMGFTHDCMISGSQAGNRTTNVNLFIGPFLPGAEQILNGNKVSNFNKVSGNEVSPVDLGVNLNFMPPLNGKITSAFGFRKAPKSGASTGHAGIDIGARTETPVMASSSGTAIRHGYNPGGYGYYMDVDHGTIAGKRIITRYAHLNRFVAADGQKVDKGQIIAMSGASGNVTGPHLHFELRINGSPVNPTRFIRF